jgi:thiol-disulfide isomerase/thioredoxin
MKVLRFSLLLLALSLTLWAGSVHAAAGQVPVGLVPLGQALPDVTMAGLNGPSRKLSFYGGKPLLINVWASWCGPCRQEMASLERLAWREQGQRFAVIGISTDDRQADASRFLQRANATVNHYIDQQLVLETLLGADRLPLTVMLDGRGKVMARYYGARPWDEAEAGRWISQALSATVR